MKVPFVDLRIQYDTIKSHIDQAIQSVLDQSQFIGGNKVDQFESDLSKYLHCKHVMTCANGTDALEIALTTLGVGNEDEVIVPAVSWIATASAVHTVGAKPVFADICPDTYTIDPLAIEKLITEKTRAIIPVHLYGQMADMQSISELAKKHDLFVLEDAAQAVGSTHHGKHIGSYGDLSVLSFYPGKNLGAYGDGGAILTNEGVFEKNSRVLGNLGQKERHDHVALGRNSKLDSMQAAVLSVKLVALDKWNQRRNAIARMYDSLLSDLPIQLPYIAPQNVSNFHLYVIQIANRDQVLSKMKERGVTCQLHYPRALPDLQPFKRSVEGDFPIARSHAEQCLSLPMYAEMTKEQVEYVSKMLHESIN